MAQAPRKSDRIVRTTATRPPGAAAAFRRLAKNASRACSNALRRLVVLRAVGEDLLELVDHDDQPHVLRLMRIQSHAGEDVERPFVRSAGRRPASGPALASGRAPAGRNRAATAVRQVLQRVVPGPHDRRSANARSRRLPPPATAAPARPAPPMTCRCRRAPAPPGTAPPGPPGPRAAGSLTSQSVRFSRPKKNFASSGRTPPGRDTGSAPRTACRLRRRAAWSP